MSENQWVVYMILTDSGKLYTGITNNLERRFDEHKNQSKGASFFHFSGPSKIVYSEPHPDRSSASKREIAIKKLTRKQKDQLIKSN
jgi:putative endonuclease